MSKIDIDAACEALVEWVSDRDPTYRARIQGVMQERQLNNRELCARIFDYVLRHSLQNELAPAPAFKDGVAPTPKYSRCKRKACRKRFEARWPGQLYCGIVCTEAARAEGEIPDITGRPQPKHEPVPEMVQVVPTPAVTTKWVEPPSKELLEQAFAATQTPVTGEVTAVAGGRIVTVKNGKVVADDPFTEPERPELAE